MRVGRRGFIGGSALAAAGVAIPIGSGAEAKQVTVTPFVETRGGRSSKTATASNALAARAVEARFSDLDEDTIRKTKRRILDLVGCAIGGRKGEGDASLVATLKGAGGDPEATVIGYGAKVSAQQAAMANAVIARSYDFEVMTVVVGDRIVGSHNSATTTMTAFAAAEKQQASGQQMIAALAMGDDIAARVLAASGFSYALGWDGAPVYSTIGATAIAANLMGLSEEQARDAFGIAVTSISGTVQSDWDGATTWKLPQGLAARNAIFSAELAKIGFVGMGDPLLAPYGFYAQFTTGCERPELLVQDLGKAYYAEEYFKPYPSCAATHASLECALALRDRYHLDADDIAKIIIRLPKFALTSALVQPWDPGRDPHASANFSIPFQVSSGFLRGPIRQEYYSEEGIKGPDITAMIKRVSCEPLPAGRTGLEITVETKSGRTLVQPSSGTPSRNPSIHTATEDEIADKFRQQVAFSKWISDDIANEIIRRVNAFEREPNVSEFMKLIA